MVSSDGTVILIKLNFRQLLFGYSKDGKGLDGFLPCIKGKYFHKRVREAYGSSIVVTFVLPCLYLNVFTWNDFIG